MNLPTPPSPTPVGSDAARLFDSDLSGQLQLSSPLSIAGASRVDLYFRLHLLQGPNQPVVLPIYCIWWVELSPLGQGDWYRETGENEQTPKGYPSSAKEIIDGLHNVRMHRPVIRALLGLEQPFLAEQVLVDETNTQMGYHASLSVNARQLRIGLQGQIGSGGHLELLAMPGR